MDESEQLRAEISLEMQAVGFPNPLECFAYPDTLERKHVIQFRHRCSKNIRVAEKKSKKYECKYKHRGSDPQNDGEHLSSLFRRDELLSNILHQKTHFVNVFLVKQQWPQFLMQSEV